MSPDRPGAPAAGRVGPLRRLGLAAVLVVLAPASALAGSTTALQPGAGVAAARVAVDPAGVAAALYAGTGGVAVQLADTSAPDRVPLPAGAVVEGFAMAAGGRPAVLARAGRGCSALVAVIRAAPGQWTTEELGGAPARAAAIATDPAGELSALAVGCQGALTQWVRAPTGDWSAQPVGVAVGADARPSLAAGAGGAAVAAWSGRAAGIAVRGPGGDWQPVGLPGGRLGPRETVSALTAALDPAGRPVALVVRGPRRAPDPASGELGAVGRSVSRLVGGAWTPFGGGAAPPVALAAAGQSLAVVRRGDGVQVESAAGAERIPVDAVVLGVGADGTLAYLPRAHPSVLGSGIPPRLVLEGPARARWGTSVSLEALLTDAGLPLAGARVDVPGATGTTDADGRARLETVLTASGSVSAESVTATGAAPAFGDASVRVVPRRSRLVGRLAVSGDRIVVRGSASGGTPLPGRLGRVWLVNLAAGPSPSTGFLPGQGLVSTPRRLGFRLAVRRHRGARYALFYEGRTRTLDRPGLPG